MHTEQRKSVRPIVRRYGPEDDLQGLLDRWEGSLPEDQRLGFHRDGPVDAGQYGGERDQIVYVLLEPNSRGGAYDRYWGADLRWVFGCERLGKSVNYNLGSWTAALLDGKTNYEKPTAAWAERQLRRVAVMNLKKVGGSGTADHMGIALHAWRDRAFIREQIRLMTPTVVVTCGSHADRLFRWIMNEAVDAEGAAVEVTRVAGLTILPAYHPSLRPHQASSGLQRLVDRARAGRVAAFGLAEADRG